MKLRRAFLRSLVTLIVFILILNPPAFAQLNERVKSINVPEGKEGEPLSVVVELVQSTGITQALLHYRPFGASEFKQLEMSISGTKASVTIPGSDIIPATIEYYFIFNVEGKPVAETYPPENPEARPLQTDVHAAADKDKTVLFLSPEPGSTVTNEELLVAISLIKTGPGVDRKATKLYIDDRDVTSAAVFSEDLITLTPENISPPLSSGSHNIRVELYDNEKKLFHTSELGFKQISLTEAEAKSAELKYNVSVQAESRNETIQSASTPYNRGTLKLGTEYGMLKVNGNLYVTNEDKAERQPQNRYLIEAEIPWFRIAYGDNNPRFPSLIMNGKRLRGLTSNLKLGFFNVDFATGEVVRGVEGGVVQTFPEDSLAYYQALDHYASYVLYDSTGPKKIWAKIRTGTYKRDLTVVRPSFGSGEEFQWGFSYLKAKDNVGSIAYGIKPQENLAVGSDIMFTFDNKHVEFTGQFAASVYNKDISRGSLRDTEIDSLFSNDADSTKKRQDLRDIRDKVSQFITVNQNLVPLSTNKLSSIMAYEGGVSFNYFGNYFKGSYIFRGNEYNSFGQTFIRRDVKGFNVYDRLRLIQNQFFVSFGIERLQDNTDDTKDATTTFTNINTTVSYYPRLNFPNITVGFGRYGSDNSLVGTDTTVVDSTAHARARTLLLRGIKDESNRYFVQLGYDFTAGQRHSAYISFNTTSREDESVYNLDGKNTSIALGISTTWKIPLQTQIGVAVNLNELSIPNTDTSPTAPRSILNTMNYTSIALGARYRLPADKLRLYGSLSPTFGDVKRMIWDIGAEYDVMRDVVASTQLSVLQNSGVSTDLIWSLVLRYNM